MTRNPKDYIYDEQWLRHNTQTWSFLQASSNDNSDQLTTRVVHFYTDSPREWLHDKALRFLHFGLVTKLGYKASIYNLYPTGFEPSNTQLVQGISSTHILETNTMFP